MILHERSSTSPAPAGLWGHAVGRLGAGEQLVLWALRRRLRDGEPASPVLVRDFRLAFRLAGLEPALAAFEDLFRALDERAAGPDPWLLPGARLWGVYLGPGRGGGPDTERAPGKPAPASR